MKVSRHYLARDFEDDISSASDSYGQVTNFVLNAETIDGFDKLVHGYIDHDNTLGIHINTLGSLARPWSLIARRLPLVPNDLILSIHRGMIVRD
jgi:hypothetical protein